MKKLLSNLTTRKKTMLGIILAVVVGLVITISALADYGHPIVAYNPNPVSITFPRAGKIVLWNVLTSGSPGYFSRYYFIDDAIGNRGHRTHGRLSRCRTILGRIRRFCMRIPLFLLVLGSGLTALAAGTNLWPDSDFELSGLVGEARSGTEPCS